MPIYLKSIQFSVVLIGILEGFAEATAGISKGYFGNLSDNLGKRLPFVRWGYLLSVVSKPMMAVFTFPLWIFSARAMDRLGKGIRTSARDAMLSDEASPGTKGRVFGFHRSMDTLGAMIGPVLALVFLYFYPGQYKLLFYIAFLPGLVAIGLTFLLQERTARPKEERAKTYFLGFLKYWKRSPSLYRRAVTGLLVFTLFNSSDVFLLLKVKDAGYSDTFTIGVYIFYNMVYAACSYPLGVIADRLGLKKILVSGLLAFVIVYVGMAAASGLAVYFVLFALYGVYSAATEGVAKAWITNIADKKDTATAIGTFTSFQSVCTMLASSIAGLLWFNFGPSVAFWATAITTLLVAIYLISIKTASE